MSRLNHELTAMVADINGEPFDASKSFERCALFLLAACQAGSVNAPKIAAMSGLPHAECKELAAKAKSSGIFTGRKIAGGDWLDPETGGIAFIMDVMVLNGTLERVPA